MRRHRNLGSAFACAAMLTLVACSASAPRKDTLYDDLGGLEGITKTTERLLDYFAADPRIRPAFAHADMHRFSEQFSQHICEVSGGPCHYKGDSMVDVHRGMAISEGQFNAVVEAYIHAMTDRGISVSAQNRLLARLAAMREDIIHK